ncbi:Hypp2591 [Branchiostoma lanceolatum]|uniref:Hypp2591 protein n=1 Tax=Branchiostoma lanceolatum TaxID=7740 RepID=A0A8J9ZVH9_BRALA|nr:Hypp2591 [Branchiostoma lanceolatum]
MAAGENAMTGKTVLIQPFPQMTAPSKKHLSGKPVPSPGFSDHAPVLTQLLVTSASPRKSAEEVVSHRGCVWNVCLSAF